MKKIVILLFSVFLAACSTTSKVSKPRETTVANKSIKGEWTLKSISYNQSGKFDVTLLNDTSKECFEGSVWKFVPNNFRGTYTITQNGCATGERYFIFVVQEIDKQSGYYDFLLKPTDQKYKSETNKGVRLNLSYLSDDRMVWKQSLQVDGAPFVISMEFTKN
ncbi:lipocalin family protein [Capnocytophaga sp.]|uniref:lipocalin family protein n=1 Tax=Capnocytophaga sp. TaxID=44737 RepID=UPI0026DD63C1|nr:lipocalin family protein [Capnocytophaga sp.]MDO5105011.1 lipocalin family protein [Capnocytophaga sp.]